MHQAICRSICVDDSAHWDEVYSKEIVYNVHTAVGNTLHDFSFWDLQHQSKIQPELSVQTSDLYELWIVKSNDNICTCEMFSNPMAYHDRNCQYQGKQFATKFWLHIGKIFINLNN